MTFFFEVNRRGTPLLEFIEKKRKHEVFKYNRDKKEKEKEKRRERREKQRRKVTFLDKGILTNIPASISKSYIRPLLQIERE